MSESGATPSLTLTSITAGMDNESNNDLVVLNEDNTIKNNQEHSNLSLTSTHPVNKSLINIFPIFPSLRQNLITFLNSSFEGQLIIRYYEKHNSLSDSMLNNLTRLLINREIQFLFEKENVTLDTPLRKLEISSKVLIDLAGEVHSSFKERTGTLYTRGCGDKDHKVGASGKFVARINYMRKILIECGLLRYADRNCSSNSVTIPLDSENKLAVLKDSTAEWSLIEKTWDETFSLRQTLIRTKTGKGIWEFSEFPCLASSKGSALVIADYKQKYPENNIDITSEWNSLRTVLEKFIVSKKYCDENAILSTKLTELSGENKDAILLLLLPYAIKAPSLPANTARQGTKPAEKRRKIDVQTTLESNNNKHKQEAFVLHVNIAADLEKSIEERKIYLRSIKESLQPFMVFVGPITRPENYYVVIDTVRYKTKSAIEALDLTFRTFFACDCAYPKLTHQAWLFIQKVCYRIKVRGEKCSTVLNKALTFFQKELDTLYD